MKKYRRLLTKKLQVFDTPEIPQNTLQYALLAGNMPYLCGLKQERTMRLRILLGCLLLLGWGSSRAHDQHPAFDKSSFYAAMASSKLEEIDALLAALKTASLPEKEAYEGALLMKKSGIVTKARDKLSLFKSGRAKLEASIARDKDNTEFRFLRLIIQEHAPKIVNYRSELEADTKVIRNNYKALPAVVQQAIVDYSKKSAVLKPSYF